MYMKTPTKLLKVKLYPRNHLFIILNIQRYFSFNEKNLKYTYIANQQQCLYYSTKLTKFHEIK